MKPKVGNIVTVQESYRFRETSFKNGFIIFSGQSGKVIKNKMGGESLVDFGTSGTHLVPQNILMS